MINQNRSKQGRFLLKSFSKRKVRSIRLTDKTWNKLTELATSQDLSIGDYLETLVCSDLLNNGLQTVINLDNICLPKDSLNKIDKIALSRSITREQFIKAVVDSSILEQIFYPISENQVKVTKLAKILNCDPKTIRNYRDGIYSVSLSEWSKSRTVDGKSWDYDPVTNRYFQID